MGPESARMPGSEKLACFGMAGEQTKRYYAKGMMLNHKNLSHHSPDYLQETKRIYTHQASPRLVEGFIDEFCFQYGIGKDRVGTNTRQYGNLVIPSTVKMLHDDLAGSVVGSGDQACFTVVSSGPECGAFILPVA